MKKILFPLTICSAVLLFACNDATDKGASNADTTTTVTESMTEPVSNIVTKTGLPLGSNQEVPANSSTGSGTADVSYNKDSKVLTYTVNYSGLSGDASMAHIHGTAAKGANAGVAHDLTSKLQKATSGSFTDSLTVDGMAIKEDSLMSGHYYFNIHTPKNPGGEIRGQIEF